MWTMLIDGAEQVVAPPRDARSSTTLRALAHAIQRMFYAPGDLSGTSEDAPGWVLPPIEQVQNPAMADAFADAFRAAESAAREKNGLPPPLSEAAPLNTIARQFTDKLRAFWADAGNRPELAALFLACGIAPTDPESGTGADDFAQRAFSLTLYGLAFSMAMHRVSPVASDAPEAEATADAEIDDADDDADGVADDSEPGEPAPGLTTTFDAARDEIARILFWSVDDERIKDPAHAMSNQELRRSARLVASGVLEILLEVLPQRYVCELEPVTTHEQGKVRTRRPVAAGPELASRIESFLTGLPFQFTLQPLRSPPVYLDTRPRKRKDQFVLDLVGYKVHNDWLERFLREGAFDGRDRLYVNAVNAQQAVPWRINGWLSGWAQCLLDLTNPAGQRTANTRERVAASGLDEATLEPLQGWVLEEFARADVGSRRSRKLKPGDFLRNPLVTSVLRAMRPDADRGETTFYLPWKADYRGRIYAETPWFTPQGGDLQRAMLEFANGRPLSDAGVTALKRHGANLVSRSRLLTDLGIKDRQVVTLEERECWIDRNEKQILASAAFPLAEPFWREVASKPLQFLAFCHAYAEWKRDPAQPCHLPVQIDGTCNGLQHIAVLTGDEPLARAVNVISVPVRADPPVPADQPQAHVADEVASASSLPGDIYSELAVEAGRLIDRPMPEPCRPVVLGPAVDLLKRIPEWRGRLDRSAAKKVVMTVPYGAGETAQAEYVLEAIGRLPMDALDAQCLESVSRIEKSVAADEKLRKRLWRIAGASFAPDRHEARKAADPDEALAEVARVEAVHASVALAIVILLRQALSDRYPRVGRLEAWLRKVAARTEGVPLCWVTPIGFPVFQDGFRIRRSDLSLKRNRREKISVGYQKMENVVSTRRQRNALLPNLIHSLDATHLALTLNAAVAAGITDFGSIHDCLLCHPDDADRLGRLVREAFLDLYGAAGPDHFLKSWYEWMTLVAQIASSTTIVQTIGCLNDPQAVGPAAPPEARQLAAAIRTLEPEEFKLAMLLLDYAKTVPQAPTGTEDTATIPKKKKAARPTRRNHSEARPIQVPNRAVRAGEPFDLEQVLQSPYFFS